MDENRRDHPELLRSIFPQHDDFLQPFSVYRYAVLRNQPGSEQLAHHRVAVLQKRYFVAWIHFYAAFDDEKTVRRFNTVRAS